jgi:high-affinity nickel-transport protein
VTASSSPSLTRQIVPLGLTVVVLHVVGWAGVWWYGGAAHPALLGLAGLAYAFGLRHAFDADHIAAIDNTTRRLMHEQARPLGVGLYFSLGHSTVVFVMTLALALFTNSMAGEMPRLREIGQYLGTTISGLFLYVIGVLNLIVMVDVYRVFRRMRRGDYDVAAAEAVLLERGFVTRWFGGLFKLVRRPYQMYLVGFLFGLGFDTATEIGLLTMAGLAASQALPLAAVLTLPVVFAAGMSLMDTADGVLMCGAYGWAFAHPLRKVFYNLTVTGLSVAVALVVGTIELLSIAAGRFTTLQGAFWDAVRHWDSQATGYTVVALFIASWLVSLGVWRMIGGTELFSTDRPH